MSDTPHEWGAEHFCKADTEALYYSISGPRMLTEHGFPVPLDANPVPATFCGRCLKWFDDPQHDTHMGSELRPPEKGTTNGTDTA